MSGLDDAALDAERDPPDAGCAARPARSSAAAPGRRRGGTTEAIGLVSVMPHACRIGRPVCSRYASDSAFGTAEPPHGITRSDDVSRPFSSGSTAIQIVGTPAATVTFSFDDQVGDRRAGQVGAGHHEVGAGGDRRRGRGPRRWRGTSARPAGSRRTRGRRGCRRSSPPIVCRNVQRWL